MATKRRRLNKQKFKELVLYIAKKSIEDPNYGAVKLNKLLAFCDFLAFAELGSPITRAKYIALQFGPVPKQLQDIQAELIDEHAASLGEVEFWDYSQRRLVPSREPDLAQFSDEEIKLVDNVIDRFWHGNATEVSELSHRLLIGWQLANYGEEIPYESIFVALPQPLTPNEDNHVREIARSIDSLRGV